MSDFDGSDGFSDGEIDEREWMEKESNAMERRSKTIGYREGLEVGKELTLQEGFNKGYQVGASHGFRCGVLNGLLKCFEHQYPHLKEKIQELAKTIKINETETIMKGEIPTVDEKMTKSVHETLALYIPNIGDHLHLHRKENHISG